jgi:hypothetical protein
MDHPTQRVSQDHPAPPAAKSLQQGLEALQEAIKMNPDRTATELTKGNKFKPGYVQMMIFDGCERIIWQIWIMLSWMSSWSLNKNQPHLPYFQAKILTSTSHFSNQYPARPFHHVLICPDDDY